jgi:NarL family two-component system response regulator LiaR
MTSPHRLTVLIADDNGLFARALETLLGAEESIAIVGRVADGEQAARQAVELAPDVVLMDLSMPHVDGIEATRRIRKSAPGTAVVVLTGSADESDMERAEEAGAAAYVTKDRILKELVETIHSAAVSS